jgi:hypothetical protein
MRPYRRFLFYCTMILSFAAIHCRQAYDPPAVKAPNDYLVVDGFINTTPNSVTTFHLNRTRNLGDSSTTGIPELQAKISIMNAHGSAFPLTDSAGNGTYSSTPLTLDPGQQYFISVTTSDGKKYASDAVGCKQTPPIDSIFWRQPGDLTIYAATHDPNASTRYYRYDYEETWEHDAQLKTAWGVSGNRIFATDSTNQKTQCWTTAPSTDVLVTTSSALADDIIHAYPLATIPQGDPRIDIRYSLRVRQYALTEDAYNYWLLIQKTSQNVGTLFDLQPTQLIGNIHCLTDPSVPVIGYISACSIQQQRIFILNSSLNDWAHNQAAFGCDTVIIPQNEPDQLLYTYPDPFYAPWYFITNTQQLVLASRSCLDCTLLGGTNRKPPFW